MQGSSAQKTAEAAASRRCTPITVAGAHGRFVVYKDIGKLYRADFLSEPGEGVEVSAAFARAAGQINSADVLSYIHDFNVRFSTREGPFDLLGSNIGAHIAPQVRRFAALLQSDDRESLWRSLANLPAALPAVLWAMSDWALPRSFRMMQGFGADLLRITSARGDMNSARFQWSPLLGRHFLLQDEARRIAELDQQYLRRDLYDAIEGGLYPAWELGVQIVSDSMPGGMSALTPIGKMVLDRNAGQAAQDTLKFNCSALNLVPGIDFPPENRPGESTAAGTLETEHFDLAALFWNSLTLSERARIVLALKLELTNFASMSTQARFLELLANGVHPLAEQLAGNLGVSNNAAGLRPPVLKVVGTTTTEAPVAVAAAEGIHSRRIALLVSDGVDRQILTELSAALTQEGALPKVLAPALKIACSGTSDVFKADAVIDASESVLFDAFIICDGDPAQIPDRHCLKLTEFVAEAHRHLKPIIAVGARGREHLSAANIEPHVEPVHGVWCAERIDEDFILLARVLIATHRFWDRK